MKKYMIIILLAIFILPIFGITTSNAVEPIETITTKTEKERNIIDGKKEIIDRGYLYNSETNVFCRQHRAAIGSNTMYELDTSCGNEGEVTYPGNQTNGYAFAYILSASRNGYNKEQIQEAYWGMLGDTELQNTKLYNIASTYQQYKTNEQEFKITTDNAQVYISGNNAIYGPIKIEYSYGECEGAKFGGFNYSFLDNNNNIINDNSVTLCKRDNNNNYTSVTSQHYQPNINTEEDYECYKVTTADYNGINLYVKVDLTRTNISKINMKIQKNVLDIEATIYQIKGQETVTERKAEYCEKCRLKGPGWYCPICDITSYNRNENVSQRLDAGVSHFINSHYQYNPYSGSNTYTCLSCNTTVYASNRYDGVTLDIRNIHAAGHIQINYGCGENYCGVSRPAGTYERQKLTILYSYSVSKGGETKAELEIPLFPQIEIDLNKYNSFGANPERKLDGAEFTVTAIQNEENLLKTGNTNGITVGTDDNILITPKSSEPVYVTITETKAPAGYRKVIEPIKITYSINESGNAWMATYAPEGSGWNWDRNNEDNDPALPNIYVSTQGDRIKVNQESSVGKTSVEIDVYNEAVIEKLELLKVDADNSNTLLAGAKFTVKLENVKSYKLTNGNSIPVDEIAIIVDLEISNGKIEIYDVVFRDENAPIVITLTETKVPDTTLEDGYYYKKLSGTITITLNHGETELTGGVDYSTNVNPENINNANLNIQGFTATITVPNIRLIDICGYVWEDGPTGVKPVKEENGLKDDTEHGIPDVVVRFASDNPNNNCQYGKDGRKQTITVTKTNNDGFYEFRGLRYNGNYEIQFEYDGINYIEFHGSKYNKGGTSDSKAQEINTERTNFNEKFKTINKGETANRVSLEYEQEPVDATQLAKEYKSTLITKINQELKGFNEKGEEYIDSEDLGCWLLNNSFGQSDKAGTVMNKYKMTAYAGPRTDAKVNAYNNYKKTTTNVNLGLVKRGTDLGLSTDVADAKVTINGQETTYKYNKTTRTIEDDPINIPHPNYNLNLYTSDYNYRIRDYVTNERFVRKQNDNTNSELDTGSELEVYVTYRLDLNNYSMEKAYINNVKYVYDSRYTFDDNETINYNNKNHGIIYRQVEKNGNTLNIDLDHMNLDTETGTSKILYLVFKVNKDANQNVTLGDFQNYAEITSYSTDEGLIDKDSAPDNYNRKEDKREDDTDIAGKFTIQVPIDNTRKISGYVQDQSNNTNINDVIVQLIELKKFNNQYYEYIWQETVSGSGTGKRLSMSLYGQEQKPNLIDYSYNKEDGYYEFRDFIPGNYIVRFIYGDGTSYDLTDNVVKDNVVKYNGQDYKSVADTNYNQEWYNPNNYTAGASVARDNEARRLETMANYVEIDAEKGLLLKLLNTKDLNNKLVGIDVSDLNEVELKTLASIEPKTQIEITYKEKLTDAEKGMLNDKITILRQNVLGNTWMCAETSKINIAVDGDANTNADTYNNINFGLEKRPETKIELKKDITAIKLVASNGQTLANASLNGDTIDGIRDGIAQIGNTLQYEVSPTEMNTILDGAKLEFVYDLVVTNGGKEDYLSSTLATEYKTDLADYKNCLTTEYPTAVKDVIKSKSYNNNIGKYLGQYYYTGTKGENDLVVQTKATSIRDYMKNDLSLVTVTEGAKLIEGINLSHYIRNDADYALKGTKINNVLESSSKNLEHGESKKIYSVTLAKNPISASGDLEFTTYIAEVMSYTNAAGRRAMTHSPGNAGFVSRSIVDNRETPPIEHLHEIDEAETETVIKVTAETGNNKKEVYIWIVSIIAGLAIIAGGIFATKKYIIKK